MFSALWILYLFLIAVIVAYFTYALFLDREENVQDATPIEKKIQSLKELVPPSSSKEWLLKTVVNGLRIWEKRKSRNSPAWIPETMYACSALVPSSCQEVIDILKQPVLLPQWDPQIKSLKILSAASNRDVISLSFNCSNVFVKTVQYIRDFFGQEVNAVFSRQWEVDANQTCEAWFMSSFTGKVISAEGAEWSCFFVSSTDDADESSSLVTLVVGPMSSLFAPVSWLTASRLAGLRDFFSHQKFDTSSVKTCQAETSVINQPPSAENHRAAAKILGNITDVPPELPFESETAASSLSPSTHEDDVPLGNVAVVAPVMAFRSQATITLSSPASGNENAVVENTTNDIQERELSLSDASSFPRLLTSESVETLIENLCELSDGTEGSDGWISVSKYKGVDILKRPAREGERPWDTLKGTSVICVPIHYIVAYVFSLEYRGEWDDLYKKGETVQQYGPLSKVTLMEYKPVWPASGRDFATFWHLHLLGEGEFCMACEAVELESCPEQKGLVRAEVVIGGFVVKELSSDPPKCLLTYVTRADLKGSLPIRLVNRVASTQPQGVAVIRDKLEARYQADLSKSNGDEMSKIAKEGVDLWKELTEGNKESGREEEEEADSFNTSDNVSYTGEMFPITEENMQLPFLDRRNIDFRTLGIQAVANLLGEVLMADQVEIPSSKESTEQQSNDGGWSYQGTEKDVAIFRKMSPGEKIHSFMGKGLIKLKPTVVWQALRDHMTRHAYDKMVKRIQVVKQIDDQTKILYLRLQAKQCILKQARDFVILTMDREETEKFIQASVSVDLPELPPSNDITRAKLKCCGWIVEPMKQNGQLYSMVSYLVQVDFGGVFPTWLLNLVTRRQPLCISYLRDYLEKSQDPSN